METAKSNNSVLVHGLEEPEGPVYDAAGNLYVVEMSATHGCVTKISPAGEILFRSKPLGRPNGMTIDGDGNLWVAEARRGAVLQMSPDGRLLATVTGPNGHRFLWPNDLRFGPDGFLYLTDSGILDTEFIEGISIRSDWADAEYLGAVYQVDPESQKVVRQLDSGIRFTNGLAFGPDEALYVNETIGGAIYRYDLGAHKTPKREIFSNVNRADGPGGWRGPDGMTFGADGRLYSTVYGQGDVTVLDATGSVVERIPVNNLRPTNLAFHPDGSGRLSVTEVIAGCVEVIETATAGLPLHAPKFH
jgi:gluconolactonase